jgi:putative SbcD/Mre11-related phosphoesterase
MKDIEFIDKGLFFKKEKMLVIADVHIGFEESLTKIGVFLPRNQYNIIKKDIKRIIDKIGKINEIIVLGDLKHEFGEISSQEWADVMDFLGFLGGNTNKIVLIKGNHDMILGPIADKKGLEIKDFYVKGGNCFIHGDKMYSECLEKGVKRLILGHKHAAISIKEDVKRETYKCFLVGKYKGKEVIVMPSFFPLTEGVEVNLDNLEDTNLCLDLDLRKFEVYVPVPDEDKVLKLGKVNDIGVLE